MPHEAALRCRGEGTPPPVRLALADVRLAAVVFVGLAGCLAPLSKPLLALPSNSSHSAGHWYDREDTLSMAR